MIGFNYKKHFILTVAASQLFSIHKYRNDAMASAVVDRCQRYQKSLLCTVLQIFALEWNWPENTFGCMNRNESGLNWYVWFSIQSIPSVCMSNAHTPTEWMVYCRPCGTLRQCQKNDADRSNRADECLVLWWPCANKKCSPRPWKRCHWIDSNGPHP